MGSVRNQFCAIVEKQRTVEEELELRRVVCNYIAGMTDNYAKQMFDEIYK
jgi:dGTP triphosphohydrolase